MINVTKINVKSFDLDHLDIYWEISPVKGPTSDAVPHQIYDYQFYVLRSESSMGSTVTIAGPLRDTYYIRDVQISLRNTWSQFYYSIKVVHVPSGEEKIFGPTASNAPEPDLIALEIRRQEDVLFREFIGRKCWIFPKRTFGPSCTCYDPVMRKRTRSSHAVCFDTGWLGGFYNPIEVFIQIDPYPKATQDLSLGSFQDNDTSARMINFPPVSPGDVLVESENKRWRVMSVSSTERLRAIVRQELRIHEIPKGEVEYDLPILVDTKTLVSASESNFRNDANIERDGEYDDIFAVYGHPRGSIS